MTNISINKEITNIFISKSSTTVQAIKNNIAIITIATQGPRGAKGKGLPLGGATGQILTKSDDESYNVQWSNITENNIYPTSVSFTYNSDGSISNINKNGLITNFSYNSNGTISTVSNTKFTKTFNYNSDNEINQIIVS